MPKKAVITFLLLALVGAALYVFFTFPRTRDEIPPSQNQVPFPSAPGPNNMPVPETPPHPNTPTVPHGPTLRVMAWASGEEVKALQTGTEAYQARTGHSASLTIVSDASTYRHEIQEALASDDPPDLCLISARDFSGVDPTRDFSPLKPEPGTAPRSVSAFTVNGQVWALPTEFSVDVLFYNPAFFDRAAIGYPGLHWNWDILEAIARAFASLKMNNAAGHPIYPLELPADFDFWNILCTQAGHPALDRDVWHLSEMAGRQSQVRALDFIHEIFRDLAVTAPLPRPNEPPGSYFAQQRAAMLIAPSELRATLPNFPYACALLPGDIARASLARVNGWAINARSKQPEAAADLAAFLSRNPIHAGWSPVQKPVSPSEFEAVCDVAFDQALVPRLEERTAPMARFLDQAINGLARHSDEKTTELYARIQSEYRDGFAPLSVESSLPKAESALRPEAHSPGELR